ncbi:related to Ammonia transport outward protein 2 [Saccharomycodes ludwigii]|uniref:Related to Ammonia transport outward protein 2 n=1 Tax=Saccharomycodes ludwigii TaxID=36035 RepID=A0A376B0R4_9ASCO|nr:related to Ammonia transport outward protein 2 [Saccharomycodes ludwigii]
MSSQPQTSTTTSAAKQKDNTVVSPSLSTTSNTSSRSQNRHEKQSANDNDTNNENLIQKITTSGDNNEYIMIGRQKFLKDELYQAFGGTLNPGLAPEATHKFANPVPLGLSAFALTTFVLSMYNARAMGITVPNVVVGVAIFYGGVAEVISGIWLMAIENTFGATALTSYGAFWMSYSALYIPWFGVIDAYEGHDEEFRNGVGFFLLGWAIFTYGLTICTLKSTVAFFGLFFFLALTFLLLSIGNFANSVGCIRAGGVIGVIASMFGWYNAYAGVANKENSYLIANAVQLPTNERLLFERSS